MSTATLTPPPIEARPACDAPVAPTEQRRLTRVCHVSMTLQTGGLERLLVEFGRCHDAKRYHLQFVALGLLGVPAEELRTMGFDVESLGLGAEARWAIIRSLAHRLRRDEVQIVHTHNTYAHFYGTMAAKMAGVPLVVNTQHGRGCGETWKHRWQFRIANRWTRKIVAVSDDCAAHLRRQDHTSRDKVVRIWNGIDVARFAFHGPIEQPVAISVARLSREKDFPTLLRGVAIAVAQVPEFRLRIVGDGVERTRLQQLATELKLSDHVEFLGERTDVPQLLAQAGFFISSSQTEGVSLTLLEAMAVGLPVLTTRVGGNPEVVDDGRTGRLVEPLDPDAIAAGIVALCRDRARWREMGRLGRERVERHFEIRGMIREYERLYDELQRTEYDARLPQDRHG